MQFIRLSSRIINTRYIQQIELSADKVHVHLAGWRSMDGMFFFGFGALETYDNVITISKKKEPEDFEEINKFARRC